MIHPMPKKRQVMFSPKEDGCPGGVLFVDRRSDQSADTMEEDNISDEQKNRGQEEETTPPTEQQPSALHVEDLVTSSSAIGATCHHASERFHLCCV